MPRKKVPEVELHTNHLWTRIIQAPSMSSTLINTFFAQHLQSSVKEQTGYFIFKYQTGMYYWYPMFEDKLPPKSSVTVLLRDSDSKSDEPSSLNKADIVDLRALKRNVKNGLEPGVSSLSDPKRSLIWSQRFKACVLWFGKVSQTQSTKNCKYAGFSWRPKITWDRFQIHKCNNDWKLLAGGGWDWIPGKSIVGTRILLLHMFMTVS